jgi:drug/metabolite transporter (DMT)-like permease
MKLLNSIISGSFAAFASGFGKYAFNDTITIEIRIICLVFLLLSNGLMLHFFVKALREDGSVIGTTVNASANVFVSALIGMIAFGETEKITQNWFLGALLALVGVYCISRGAKKEKVE